MNTTTITIDGVILSVAFDYTPPSRGSRDCYGAPLEPDTPEELEIVSIHCDGDIADLISAGVLGMIEEVIREQACEERRVA